MKITVENVDKTYGDVMALDGLSLEIPAETTFGVLGTNGAGKTTLFKLLLGHDRPDSGSLFVGEREVTEAGVEIREHVGYLPERVGFPAALTGREVLTFHARMRDLPWDGRIDRVLDMVGLAPDDVDRAVSGYSHGMRRRLGLAAALLPDPAVLVLDEPTAGLDPSGVLEFHRIVSRVRERTDATVVITSHVLSEVESICDEVAILQDGRLRAAGPVTELASGNESTVRIRPVETERISDILDRVGEFGQGTRESGTVLVQCDPDEIPSLFAALDGISLADTTVERAGLEVAFHEAIGTEQEVIP